MKIIMMTMITSENPGSFPPSHWDLWHKREACHCAQVTTSFCAQKKNWAEKRGNKLFIQIFQYWMTNILSETSRPRTSWWKETAVVQLQTLALLSGAFSFFTFTFIYCYLSFTFSETDEIDFISLSHTFTFTYFHFHQVRQWDKRDWHRPKHSSRHKAVHGSRGERQWQ